MQKSIRQRLPEIIFFIVTFAATSVILRSHYHFISDIFDSFLLNFGLHFSYWTGFYRSCVIFFADISITVLVFLIARYIGSIQIKTGKNKLITSAMPVIISLTLTGILCELQVFRREDFWEVQYSKDLGLFKFISQVLQTEGGRYFSYFLKGFNAFFRSAISSMIYMNTCLFISLITLFTGLYRLLLILLTTSASTDQSVSEKKMAFFYAFCLFSAIIFTSPKIWEDWFWDAGGLIFGIGISLSVWSFALIVEDVLNHPNQRKKAILPSLILFCACGCNQITTLAIDILITETVLYVLLSRQKTIIKRRIIFYFFITAASSVICLLAPGNFLRLIHSPYNYPNLSESGLLSGRLFLRLYQQISVNVIMMKNYWFFLIIISFFFGSMVMLRNKKMMMLLSAGMLLSGFFSLLLNCMLDYMPARIYAAAFIWLALSVSLVSMVSGSLIHGFLKNTVLPVRIQSAYVFLLVIASFCPVFFLYHENRQLLLDIRSAWFYRDKQIQSIPASFDQIRSICGVPIIDTNWTDIKYAEAFIANYYGLGGVEDSGVCPPFISFSKDPAQWR